MKRMIQICCLGILGMMLSPLKAQEVKKGYYPNGNIRYEGLFEGMTAVGKVTRYYPDGQVQAVMMHNGPEVSAVLYSKDGTFTSAGKYLNRRKEGAWKYSKGEQVLLLETYKNNILEGSSFKYYLSGNVAEERNWEAGKLSGKWKTYFPDGQLRLEAFFAGGVLEGEVRVYTPEGVLSVEGVYRNNLKEGLWRYYDQAGKVIKERKYLSGIAEDQQEEDIEETKQLDEWIKAGKQIPDPARFTEEPEMYLRMIGE